jgi:uncharacterized phage protein gp47/JayE
MATNVPAIEWTSTGLVLPQELAILAGAQADQNAAFGGNLSSNLETPQGQLASSEAAIIADLHDKFAYYVNQVNPDYSEGFMQDGISRLYYLTRHPAVSTVVNCDCVGVPGTVIPVGFQVADGSGNTYACTTGGTIPIDGTISLSFANIVTGAIPAPSGTVASILSVLSGLDTVINPSAGVMGIPAESRADFEYRRKNSVARFQNGSLSAIYAAVSSVANVSDCYCIENSTGTAVSVGETAYSLLPHSVYIAVQGGISDDIGIAIWTAKDPGANYNGNTTVTVADSAGYAIPYPTYQVTFQRPIALPVKFAVNLAANSRIPGNYETLVKAAITAAFTGSDGGDRARIGSEIVAGRFYAGVAAASPYISILSILLGTSTPTGTSVTAGIDQFPTIQDSDITVTVI